MRNAREKQNERNKLRTSSAAIGAARRGAAYGVIGAARGNGVRVSTRDASLLSSRPACGAEAGALRARALPSGVDGGALLFDVCTTIPTPAPPLAAANTWPLCCSLAFAALCGESNSTNAIKRFVLSTRKRAVLKPGTRLNKS